MIALKIILFTYFPAVFDQGGHSPGNQGKVRKNNNCDKKVREINEKLSKSEKSQGK